MLEKHYGPAPEGQAPASVRYSPATVSSIHKEYVCGSPDPALVANQEKEVPEGYHVVYTKWITLKNGKRLFAKSYGRKCWRIVVRTK